MRTSRAVIALAVVSIAGGVASAPAQAPTPRDPTKPCPGATNPLPGETCGDNYLESVRIATSRIMGNLLGFSDTVDTSNATTQPDLFKPGGNRAGPAEPTTCSGKAYGKTVWYDLNPSVDGDLLVQAVGSGFDPVISLVRYDVRDAPNFRPISAFTCSNQETGPREQLRKTRLRRGRGYSVQIGGVSSTGGPLDLDVNFTPYRIHAEPKLAFQLTPDGVRLVNLRVTASSKSRVAVGCKPGCGKRAKSGRRVNFKLGGKQLRAGGKLTIRVTRGGYIGSYFVYRIRRGKIPIQSERCLNPGSKKPRKRCP